jgi:hypothetical protein
MSATTTSTADTARVSLRSLTASLDRARAAMARFDAAARGGSAAGLRVVESPLAIATRCVVRPWPIRKRRRGYRVVREQVPSAYIADLDATGLGVGRVLIAHPTIVARLRDLPGGPHV